jgi:hypothetical protein
MALLEKLRRVLGNRYTPFFLPVIGSLAYIGIVILVVPENLGQHKSDSDESEEVTTPAGSLGSANAPTDNAALLAKRRARQASRAARQTNTAPGMNSPNMPPPGMSPAAPPAPMPASPDGAD